MPAEEEAPLPPLTCYIRTRNEAQRVRPCIEAARRVAREVVVVASESTDDTVAVVEAMGARVITQPWLGNGYQKRVGEDAASHDWLLDLDADEYLSDALVAEIRALFREGEPPPNRLFSIAMHTLAPNGQVWTHFDRGRVCKLYNRTHVRIPAHPEWDRFKPPAGSEVCKLQHPILHAAYRSIEHLMGKMNRVSSNRTRNTPLKGRGQLALRVVFLFPFYFLKSYLLRGYFRGGLYGLTIASVIAYGRWLRDAKMLERHLCPVEGEGDAAAPKHSAAAPAKRDDSAPS